jgi:hypothetical protein
VLRIAVFRSLGIAGEPLVQGGSGSRHFGVDTDFAVLVIE